MKEHERLVADAIEKRHERISKKIEYAPATRNKAGAKRKTVRNGTQDSLRGIRLPPASRGRREMASQPRGTRRKDVSGWNPSRRYGLGKDVAAYRSYP